MKIFEIIKMPIKFVVVIALITFMLLFLPDNIIIELQLQEFLNEYGKYIGIIFLLTVSYLILSFIIYISKKIYKWKRKQKRKKEIIEHFNSMDFHELCVLREFYLQGKNTIDVPIDNSVVAGLLSKGILVQVSRNGLPTLLGLFYPVRMAKCIDEICTPEDLGIKKDMTDHQINKISDERPRFIDTLNDLNNLRRF